ncbi:MAG: CAP domain-containing protein [Sulfobacillus sp.]|nr:CAP domain-containing protein [Sulfobacillus sp.]
MRRRQQKALGWVFLLGILGLWAVPLDRSPDRIHLWEMPIRQFGPWATAAHDGYESGDLISPIVPPPVVNQVSPRWLGVQFIGDSRQHLLHDDLRLTVAKAGKLVVDQRLTEEYNGFVGFRLRHPLAPGTYRASLVAPGFSGSPETWSFTVRKNPIALNRTPSRNVARVLAALNTLRTVMGLSPVAFDASLAAASEAHVLYLARHGYDTPSFHEESSGQTGFTGVNPWDRDLAFGWPEPVAGEVGIETGSPILPEFLVQDLIDTVYHRLALLSDNLESLGLGEHWGDNGSAVMDLGFGYRPTLPSAIVYPYPGQPGVPTRWVDWESPDPAGSGEGQTFGYPITVDLPTVDRVMSWRLTLWKSGRPVPGITDAPGTGDLDPNQAGFIPQSPLAPDTPYTVVVRGRAQYNGGVTKAFAYTWTFATGGGGLSVSAAVEPPRVILGVSQTGTGTAVPGMTIRLFRRVALNQLVPVATGRSDPSGMAVFSLAGDAPGLYEAVTSTGNAVVFSWRANHGQSSGSHFRPF